MSVLSSSAETVVELVVIEVVVFRMRYLFGARRSLTLFGARFFGFGGLKLVAVCFLEFFGRPMGILHVLRMNGVLFDAEFDIDLDTDSNAVLKFLSHVLGV